MDPDFAEDCKGVDAGFGSAVVDGVVVFDGVGPDGFVAGVGACDVAGDGASLFLQLVLCKGQ